MQRGRPLDYEKARILDEQAMKVAGTLEKTDIIGQTEKALIAALKDNPELESELFPPILKGLGGAESSTS